MAKAGNRQNKRQMYGYFGQIAQKFERIRKENCKQQAERFYIMFHTKTKFYTCSRKLFFRISVKKMRKTEDNVTNVKKGVPEKTKKVRLTERRTKRYVLRKESCAAA